jgi:hypothetical protein
MFDLPVAQPVEGKHITKNMGGIQPNISRLSDLHENRFSPLFHIF